MTISIDGHEIDLNKVLAVSAMQKKYQGQPIKREMFYVYFSGNSDLTVWNTNDETFAGFHKVGNNSASISTMTPLSEVRDKILLALNKPQL